MRCARCLIWYMKERYDFGLIFVLLGTVLDVSSCVLKLAWIVKYVRIGISNQLLLLVDVSSDEAGAFG